MPLLIKWIGMPPRKAFATSVAIILPLCAVSLLLLWQKQPVDLPGAMPYLLGGLCGGVISGRIFHKIPVVWLRRVFGLLLLYGGIKAVLLL